MNNTNRRRPSEPPLPVIEAVDEPLTEPPGGDVEPGTTASVGPKEVIISIAWLAAYLRSIPTTPVV